MGYYYVAFRCDDVGVHRLILMVFCWVARGRVAWRIGLHRVASQFTSWPDFRSQGTGGPEFKGYCSWLSHVCIGNVLFGGFPLDIVGIQC